MSIPYSELNDNKLESNSIILEVYRSDAVSINANSNGFADVLIEKSNYRPIAVSGFFKTGTNTNQCMCYEYWFEDGTFGFSGTIRARAYFRNYGSSTANFTVDFVVTYVKI